MRRHGLLTVLLAAIALVSCGPARVLADGEYILKKNKIEVNDKHFNAGKLCGIARH